MTVMKIHTQCRWERFYNIDPWSSTVIDLFNVTRSNIPKSKSEVQILHKYSGNLFWRFTLDRENNPLYGITPLMYDLGMLGNYGYETLKLLTQIVCNEQLCIYDAWMLDKWFDSFHDPFIYRIWLFKWVK